MNKTAAVITVSDRSHRGEREDFSGPAVAQMLRQAGFEITGVEIIPDDEEKICTVLYRYVDRAQLVVTTGGTGVAKRDVTPEATLAICERLIPGIPEVMRSEGVKKTPMAPLSRGVCGTRGSTLILNVPGNPNGAVESLQAVMALVLHALELLAGNTDHS
jgi:molybdenum cofactor synthesis domain-containing protein